VEGEWRGRREEGKGDRERWREKQGLRDIGCKGGVRWKKLGREGQ
jgi:hypothetical protein